MTEFTHHLNQGSAASSVPCRAEQLLDHAAKCQTFYSNFVAAFFVILITAKRHIKCSADQPNRLLLPQLVYQRVCCICSDIKRAVAFFKIVFSRSNRSIRASSSLIRCCSGVNALLLGVMPTHSCFSCETQRRSAVSPMPSERLASANEYPCWVTSWAASSLKSVVNDRRIFVIEHLFHSGNVTT